MKNSELNRKNVGAAGIASKACAWILSIMLVVTGMAPSFATNNKAGKDGAVGIAKATAGAKATSKTKEVVKDNVTSKTKTVKKPGTVKNDVGSSLKNQKIPKDKEEKNGKKKFRNKKQERTFNLNASGNVKASIGNGYLYVEASEVSGDRKIERKKWGDMVKALGGTYDESATERINWSNASGFAGGVYFSGENKIFLPEDSSYFFYGLKKDISYDEHGYAGLQNLIADNVTNMEYMFATSVIKEINISDWKLNATLLNNPSKMQNMFTGCVNLEWIKTPAGLKTNVNGANNDFKIVKLKKGTAATIESESKNLNSNYAINSSGDKENVYHIYRKDKCVGVIFDKNAGDGESWVNHAIVRKNNKGKGYVYGKYPKENPQKEGYWLDGWSLDKNATSYSYIGEIDKDTTLYAVYKRIKVMPLNDSGNVYVLPKVETTGRITLGINVKDTKDDIRIQKNKWREMAAEFHANASHSEVYWAPALKYIDIKFLANVKAPSDMSGMFNAFCDNRDDGGSIKGLEKLDVSEVTDAFRAFAQIRIPLDGESFANWDTGNISNFSEMFSSSYLVNPNVNKWNMKKAQNLKGMFSGAELANPDVSKWNVKNVTNIEGMFSGAKSANPDISKWRPINIVNMENAFEGSNIEKADLSKWDISPNYDEHSHDLYPNLNER